MGILTTSPLNWQSSLFDGAAEPDVDDGFAGLTRDNLDDTAWIEHVPSWVEGADTLFQWVLDSAAWHTGATVIHGERKAYPRLLASWPYEPCAALLPPILERMRAVLSQRYGRQFDSVHANLYRDGRDSVTWHGDRIAASVRLPTVAIVSLGHPRRFLLRPRGGTTHRTLMLGRGDLLVTGGSTQRSWQHAVPKVAVAGPRISLTLRHSSNDAAAQPAHVDPPMSPADAGRPTPRI